jgi:hypothetical protein
MWCRRVNNYERFNNPDFWYLKKNLHKNLKSGTDIPIYRAYKSQTFIISIDAFNIRRFQYKF